ncbi:MULTISPECIES: outer membrane protein [Alphaproteobacteria]|uniref:Porin n=2 Tax=Alphaproteobacteria TaxID=28211 RepID=A0A512HG59_9HYPH|nr:MULTISPECIES: outer membrane protein [Alphaproteobacteria]GEO84443.1 porin [Ciceribacter naphthalenivorans]GLR22406.1 porin [Ciceribacter naphthalenivorans]GLT05262.1 porin [Sphingomonas psychrolutea]
MSAVILAAMVTPAAAADMSTPLSVPTASDWTGFYVGGHLGGGRSIIDWTYDVGGTTADHKGDGVLGGAQLGYNLQSGNWVFGGEADISASGIDGDTDCPNPAFTCSSDTKWLSTVRGRLGYTFDNLLIYGTGGLGIGRFEMSTNNGAGTSGSTTKTDTGWVAGAGVEYAFSPRWSVKAEYMYYDFGSTSYEVDNGLDVNVDSRFHTGKIGVNFKF